MKKLFYKLQTRAETIQELCSFFWHHKLWWLLPLIIVIIIAGILIITASATPLAPFVYPLF